MRRKRSLRQRRPKPSRSRPSCLRGYAVRVRVWQYSAVATEAIPVCVFESVGSHGPDGICASSRFRWHFDSLALVVV